MTISAKVPSIADSVVGLRILLLFDVAGFSVTGETHSLRNNTPNVITELAKGLPTSEKGLPGSRVPKNPEVRLAR